VGEGEGEGCGETTTGGRISLASVVIVVVGARTGTTRLLGIGLGTAALVAVGGAGTLVVLAGALIGTKDAILALKIMKKRAF